LDTFFNKYFIWNYFWFSLDYYIFYI